MATGLYDYRRINLTQPLVKLFDFILVIMALSGPCVAERALASWYGPGFHGRTAADGASFDSTKLTAAHKTRPLGQIIMIRNVENQRTIRVTITDRGPYHDNRGIDLSEAAAAKLRMRRQGVVPVEIRSDCGLTRADMQRQRDLLKLRMF